MQAISASSAGVSASVNPNGRRTTYWFQYGTSAGYGSHTPPAAAGAGRRTRQVRGTITGLSPLTTYHYRVVASHCGACSGGIARGADGTFTTGGYGNAVYGEREVPDPFVLIGASATDYWAFSTGEQFPILHSTDLVHWTDASTALTAKPAWVVQSGDWHPWAPHVVSTPGPCPGSPPASAGSCYVMFYVGLSAQFNANCVAVATAASPAGPYEDRGPLPGAEGALDATGRPAGCGDNGGYGMIDPSTFVDPATGQRYLYASEDFACAQPTTTCTAANSALQPTISVIPLSDDYLSAAGPRTPLFSGDPETWEQNNVAVPTVEGPAMIEHDGTYYLLYSGGNWRSTYGMGYATGPSATGPFTKSTNNPILSQRVTVSGPGGGEAPVSGPHGGQWMIYHGRDQGSNPRTLRIDPFGWRPDPPAPDVPVIAGPTSGPQPIIP